MIMSTPCLDFSFREPGAMDLRYSNMPSLPLPLLIWVFHEMDYYVKVKVLMVWKFQLWSRPRPKRQLVLLSCSSKRIAHQQHKQS